MLEMLNALLSGSMMLYSLAMENPLIQELSELLANSPLAAMVSQLASLLYEAGSQGVALGAELSRDLLGK